MLTLFTIPKAFDGHIGDIQRNAIQSWTLLRPKCEIILLADDEGTAKVAEEFGVKHIPDVQRNEFGTPLLDSAYQLAEEAAGHSIHCYINADIILTNDFLPAVNSVAKQSEWFMMTARRWNLDVSNRRDFSNNWESGLLDDVATRGALGKNTQIDFWVYSKGLLSDIPALAVGRMAFECWCLYKARAGHADLIDATASIVSVHQNHDYAHHPQGAAGIGKSIEAERNRELVGGKPYFFTIRDRTHVLTPKGLKRTRDGWRLWRSIRAAQVLPMNAPLPARLAVGSLNAAINGGRDLAIRVLNRRTR